MRFPRLVRARAREHRELHPPPRKAGGDFQQLPGRGKVVRDSVRPRGAHHGQKPEDISDEGTYARPRGSKRIENELEYPGQIKVNVIRETRCTEFAK